MDHPQPRNGRNYPPAQLVVLGIASLISAARFVLPLQDYLQGLLTWSVSPLLQYCTLLCDYGLTSTMINTVLPGLPISGETVTMLVAVVLASLNVLQLGMVVLVVITVATWRLMWHTEWVRVVRGPRPAPANNQILEPQDRPRLPNGPVAVLEQLGVVTMVPIMTAPTDGSQYMWLNKSPQESNGGPGGDVRGRYFLKLVPDRCDTCRIPLQFTRENENVTVFTGVQTLTVKFDVQNWRTEELGLKAESLKVLQDALTSALVQKQCSDEPPTNVKIVNAGPEVLKNSTLVITIGYIDNGFLVVRVEDLLFNNDRTEVRAIRAIYFVRGNDTTGDLNPPAAFAELERYNNSLQKVIYTNILRPFLEYTANPPAV